MGRLPSPDYYCQAHGIVKEICPWCNPDNQTTGYQPVEKVTKRLPFPSQKRTVRYNLTIDPGVSQTIEVRSDGRVVERRPPRPEYARLFKAANSMDHISVKYIPPRRTLMVFTRTTGIELTLAQTEDCISALISAYCCMNNRRLPRDAWKVPVRIDRLLPAKWSEIQRAGEEAARLDSSV